MANAVDVKALTSWRNRRDVREVVRHETKSELPDEVKALLISMRACIEDQGHRIERAENLTESLRHALELLAIAASKGADSQ